MQQDNIIFSVHPRPDGQNTGLIILNRPSLLNALDYNMAVTLRETLLGWADDDTISHVVMAGATPRAFCAGGDVRALFSLVEGGDHDQVVQYFKAEYLADLAVAEFPKPIIALADGVVMGGGAGLMQASSHAIVSNTTKFAMPESAIGLFPDAGATVFLGRCPRAIGLKLGMTGRIIGGADCLMLGLATSMAHTDQMPALQTALLAADAGQIDQVLADFQIDPGPTPLQNHRAAIEFIFSGDDPVLMRDRAHDMATIKGDEFAGKIHHALSTRCPMTIALFVQMMQKGEDMTDLGDCLAQDFHLAVKMSARTDFREGVRAVLIDKTNDPHWSPNRLEDVDQQMIDDVFDHAGLPPLR